MSWNYRVSTKMFSYADTFPENEGFAKMEDQRLFSIIEVYYDKKGKPKGYADDIKPTANWETLTDLENTIDLIKLAHDKPIIDLDNFPNEWKEIKHIEDCKFYDEAQGRYLCVNTEIKHKKCGGICSEFQRK